MKTLRRYIEPPEYFEELAKKGDKKQELIDSAWHNVAHMVISKLDIQEVD